MTAIRILTLFVAVFTSHVSMAEEPEVWDAIVVGLGAAGSGAVERLASTWAGTGKKVLALEAQSRIGGRVHTYVINEQPKEVVELGAEWIHGQKGNAGFEIATSNSIPIEIKGYLGTVIITAGNNTQSLTPETKSELMRFFFETSENMPSFHNETVGQFFTKKFTDYVKNNEELKNSPNFCKELLRSFELLVRLAEGFDSWEEETLAGSEDFKETPGPHNWSWHTYGYHTLFDILYLSSQLDCRRATDWSGVAAEIADRRWRVQARVDERGAGCGEGDARSHNNKTNNGRGVGEVVTVELDTEVTRIDWANQDIVVHTAKGNKHKAKNVIVTISLGVMKSKHSNLFSPSLPTAKVAAIDALSFGTVDKVVLVYEKQWWGHNDSFVFVWSEELSNNTAEDEWWLRDLNGASESAGCKRCLTFWTTGKAAKYYETLSDEVVHKQVTEFVRKFMPAAPHPIQIIRTKWYSNPFTKGSYSYHGMGWESNQRATDDLREPLKSGGGARLLFAGEATSAHHFGTVHGALETGRAAVEALLAN